MLQCRPWTQRPPLRNSPLRPSSNAAEPAAPRLKLHIPAHHPASGERPDLSYVPRFPAGAVERPDIAVPAQETHPLAYTLIRVLDDDGGAVGAWDPKLPPETLRPRSARDDADPGL